jgi:hypothetical protein
LACWMAAPPSPRTTDAWWSRRCDGAWRGARPMGWCSAVLVAAMGAAGCPLAVVDRELPARLPAGSEPGGSGQFGPAWAARPAAYLRDWLEDGGIPGRVIDELMGHRAGRAGGREGGGSAIGVVYRHLTPEMRARVLAVVDECSAVSLEALAAPMRPQERTPTRRVMRGWPRSDADLQGWRVELRGFEPRPLACHAETPPRLPLWGTLDDREPSLNTGSSAAGGPAVACSRSVTVTTCRSRSSRGRFAAPLLLASPSEGSTRRAFLHPSERILTIDARRVHNAVHHLSGVYSFEMMKTSLVTPPCRSPARRPRHA